MVALVQLASYPTKTTEWPSKSPVPETTGAVVLVLVVFAGLVVLVVLVVAVWLSLTSATGKTGFSI